jgi:SAM-dependent methyltransferase
VSGFAADWLALREPYDLRARNAAVLNAVIASLTDHSAVNIVDLACGTGSTLRALAPRLPAKQVWRLADNDRGLLALASNSLRPAHVTIAAMEADLNRDLGGMLGGAIDVVTTSALLDLVSEAWLQRFVREAVARSLPVYAALCYDGRTEIAPTDEFDDAIIAAVNAHQRGDKGFGPALGPLAAQAAIARFEAAGYSVVQGQADWIAGAQDQDFQIEIFRGWAAAASELGTLSGSNVDGWRQRRGDFVAAGRSSLRVGHVDFFATPITMR